MTTGKPPQPPHQTDKTVYGTPGDAQGALQKLPAEQSSRPPPLPGAPARAQPALDPQRTLLGNPHAAAPSTAAPRTPVAPPKLPQSQPFRPPAASPAQSAGAVPPDLQRTQFAAPASPQAQPSVSVQRTQFAAPSQPVSPHPQAAGGMQRTQFAAPAAPQAQPSVSVQRTQFAAPAAAQPSNAQPYAPGSSGPPPLQPQRLQAPPPPGHGTSRPAAAVAAPAGHDTAASQPPVVENSRSGVQRSGAAPASSIAPAANSAAASHPAAVPGSAPPKSSANVGAPAFNSTEPDRERDSKRSPRTSAKLPDAAPPAGGLMATRLVAFEPGALPPQASTEGTAGTGGSPQLSLNEADRTERKSAPPKRWPALSLLALAIVSFGGVVVVRAPQLLPAPLLPIATLLISQLHLAPQPAATPPSTPLANEPAAQPTGAATLGVAAAAQPAAVPGEPATPTAAPVDPAAQPGAVAEPPGSADAPNAVAQPGAVVAPAGSVEAAAALEQPGAVVQPAGPAPVPAQGATAELEKQAIDLLLANDYSAASVVYERLRGAEPGRPEYSVMLELLAREIAAGCGGPGQAPCAQQ